MTRITFKVVIPDAQYTRCAREVGRQFQYYGNRKIKDTGC